MGRNKKVVGFWITDRLILMRGKQRLYILFLGLNPSVPRSSLGPVWGLGTGPAAVHWSLDEHP